MNWLSGERDIRRGYKVADGPVTVSVFSVLFRYLALLDCARDWHRPSWPVGGFVKRAYLPRPSAEHIGRPPPLYPAGLLP